MDDPHLLSAFEAHMGRLEEIGWFSQYSEGDPRAACRQLFDEGVPAHWCIPPAPIDPECVYSEGDHREILLDVVASAHGLLRCDRIVETWEGDFEDSGNEVPITVEIHVEPGRVISRSWVQEGDYLFPRFTELLAEFVESQGVGFEEIDPGHWIVGRWELLEHVTRIGFALDNAQYAQATAPDQVVVPSAAPPEERRAWWLFSAGFYLEGAKMKTWRMMFGDGRTALKKAYLAAMDEAFADLPPQEKRALVAREIGQAADKLRPHEVALAMGVSVERLYELVDAAQSRLRQAGERLWARSDSFEEESRADGPA